MARARIAVNLTHLHHNFLWIKEAFPKQRMLAMVKNNGYGHDLVQTARTVQEADFLGVSDIEEALELREKGIQTPVVVMGGLWSVDDFFECLARDIFLLVYDVRMLDLLLESELRPVEGISLWVKVDTGMNRLGVSMDEAKERLSGLDDDLGIANVTVMTHFANADQMNNARMDRQVEIVRALQAFVRGLTKTTFFSFANSATCMNYPEFLGDIIRPGLMLYGVFPNKALRDAYVTTLPLKPVITLTSTVLMLRQVMPGEAVGYESRWVASRPTTLAIVSLGYGDGYYRYAQDGTPVVIRGKRAPLVGRVSMDMITVDVTDLDEVCVGDDVLLWGEGLPVEEIGAFNGASFYDLLTTVGSRGVVDFIPAT